jgi:hypothetical protein
MPGKLRRPRLTDRVMSGLCFAYGHAEADDLSDFEDESFHGDIMRDFEAAGRWLAEMSAYREAKRSRKTKSD